MSHKPLSPTMAYCLSYTEKHGGSLFRSGDSWRHPSMNPQFWFRRVTVQALVDRGEMVYTHWTPGRFGPYATKAELTKKST